MTEVVSVPRVLGHATTRSVECGRHDGTGPAGARETPVYVACLTCRAWGGRAPPVPDGAEPLGSRASRRSGSQEGDVALESTLRCGDGPASPAPALRARPAPAARPVRARRHRPAAAPRRRRRRPAGDRPAAHPARGVRLLRRRRRRRAVAPPGPGGVRAGRVPSVGAARRVVRRHRPRHPRPARRPAVRVRPHRLHPDDAHRGRARGGVGGRRRSASPTPCRRWAPPPSRTWPPPRRTPGCGSSSTCGATAPFGKDLVQRAAAAGYDTLMLTVDTPAGGARLRDVRNGLVDPARAVAAHVPRRRACTRTGGSTCSPPSR